MLDDLVCAMCSKAIAPQRPVGTWRRRTVHACCRCEAQIQWPRQQREQAQEMAARAKAIQSRLRDQRADGSPTEDPHALTARGGVNGPVTAATERDR
jgi:hypothetical protein